MLIKESTSCDESQLQDDIDVFRVLDDCLNKIASNDLQEATFQNDVYQKIVKQLSKSVCCISNYFQQCTIFDSSWRTLLYWTRNEQLFTRIFALLQDSQDVTSASLGVLLCTAALERALGNVYMMSSTKIPSLMKDLLASKELYNVFGEKLHLLQIVIGSPLSLNIRNILWHGFAAPNEIPIQLGHFLFAMTLDFGNVLNKRAIGLNMLPFRHTVEVAVMFDLKEVFPDLLIERHIDVLEELFLESPFIPSVMLPFWQLSVKKLQEHRYAECVALILPQIEHSLRCLFAFVNDCPERALTAESTVCYTTFDEILAPQLANGTTNRLMTSLKTECFVALQDIFIYPDGPRIRDHFSHGEYDFYEVPRVFATHLMCLAGAFCIELLPVHHPLRKVEPIQSICSSLYTYEPKFHPCQRVKQLIIHLLDSFGTWPTYHNSDANLNELGCVSFTSSFKAIISGLSDNFRASILRLLNWDQFNEAVEQVKCFLMEFRCHVLHRPHCEWTVLMQLCRILEKAQIASTQVSREVLEKTRKLQEWKLHSRQRITFQTMLSNVSYLKMCLSVAAVIAIVFLFSVNGFSVLLPKDQKAKLRFLRLFEKYVENLKSVTCPSKNHWQKSKELGEQFLETILKHPEIGIV